MKNFLKLSLVAVIALFVGVAIYSQTHVADASVTFGNDYKSVEITSANASTSPLIIATSPGSFGSIIVASSSSATQYFRVYDNAQSTSSATSTRLVSMTAVDTPGTYTFDIAPKRGLVLDVPVGFNGDYVITYR